MSIHQVRFWCWEFTNSQTDVHDELRTKSKQFYARSSKDHHPGSCYACSKDMFRFRPQHWVIRCAYGGCYTFSQLITSRNTLTVLEIPSRMCQACFDSIVTSDDTWCCHFTSEGKDKSHQWLHTIFTRANKFKQSNPPREGHGDVFLGPKWCC